MKTTSRSYSWSLFFLFLFPFLSFFSLSSLSFLLLLSLSPLSPLSPLSLLSLLSLSSLFSLSHKKKPKFRPLGTRPSFIYSIPMARAIIYLLPPRDVCRTSDAENVHRMILRQLKHLIEKTGLYFHPSNLNHGSHHLFLFVYSLVYYSVRRAVIEQEISGFFFFLFLFLFFKR